MDNEGSGHSVYTPDTPSHSQPQSSPSQAAPSPNPSSNHQITQSKFKPSKINKEALLIQIFIPWRVLDEF